MDIFAKTNCYMNYVISVFIMRCLWRYYCFKIKLNHKVVKEKAEYIPCNCFDLIEKFIFGEILSQRDC